MTQKRPPKSIWFQFSSNVSLKFDLIRCRSAMRRIEPDWMGLNGITGNFVNISIDFYSWMFTCFHCENEYVKLMIKATSNVIETCTHVRDLIPIWWYQFEVEVSGALLGRYWHISASLILLSTYFFRFFHLDCQLELTLDVSILFHPLSYCAIRISPVINDGNTEEDDEEEEEQVESICNTLR